ncbi:MAG TPA: NAD-dependent dehydratase [Cyanobacteria bacterium UBA8803]|nr:NAD-dependent dehydratase [Cyanobacteria bacterium UBA9273]HBL61160.1 NAD-dependent dehydratase [Cyanobacteria bacterium UBA8803]
MTWVGKKVLVTGAGGFIGSHLGEALIETGAQVTAMLHYNSQNSWGNLELLSPQHRAELNIVAGNIEDSDFVARQVKNNQVVFHLAALIAIPYSYIAPRSYVRTNIEGTLNVLEAARNFEIERVVHTSTSETYGTAIYTPIDENHPLQGQSPYSASKIGADKIAESYYSSFGLPVSTIRPFNTYGPRQSARAVIPTIISQALTQKEIRLGSLDPVRDLTYVKDTVRGFIKVAESEQTIGKVTNVGCGKGITIGDLAKTILSLMGSEKPIVLDQDRVRPSTSEVFKLICDNSKALERMDWQPQYSLEAGLQEVITFVSKHQGLFKSDRYTV